MADTNIVTLNTQSYNQIKADNIRLEMMLENILLNAEMNDDHTKLMFDSEAVRIAIQFCFPERYKKKLATLKTQYARYGQRGADIDADGNPIEEDTEEDA